MASRRQYPFDLIEPKWQRAWAAEQTFRAFNPGDAVPATHPFGTRHALAGQTASAAALPPKYYILDMFPYPSGAGLHVGHPEGYTATDILARYRRALGFNVLHPMGWDSFGLPAEQYAVKTGQHPRVTTEANIANFTRQIKSLGFSYDWTRELATTDPGYFRWTQWIFLQVYHSWFNPETNRAEPIATLKYPEELAQVGRGVLTEPSVSEAQRRAEDSAPYPADLEARRRAFRDSKRLAYVAEQPVWWCEGLGTVLANEEVVDGQSEVGGFPVVRKPMRQWVLRITAFAERLLNDLHTIEWTDSLKEMQRNWIGRSEGAEVEFRIPNSECRIRVFTTRPDTLFGATYMVLSPEHKLVKEIIPPAWPTGTPEAWKGVKPALANVTPCKADVEPLKTEANLSEIYANSSQENVNLSKKDINLSKEDALSSKKDVLPLKNDVLLSKKDVLPSEKDVLPSEKDVLLPNEEVCFSKASLGCSPAEVGFATPAEAVSAYQAYASGKSDLERTELAKEKTGVFTGAYALNPVNGEKIPIWIADYVLASYGTGAIMAVPGHDERDLEFARKFDLPVRVVVQAPAGKDSIGFLADGVAVNSDFLNGLPTAEAKAKIAAWLEAKGLGQKTINYKLRDWLFSRQRYWGEPFPIVWKRDAAGTLYHEAVPEKSLPVLPPALTDYKPTSDGQPPLARATEWVQLKSGAMRETNTMPQWAGSCWYYLRYLDTQNARRFVARDAERYWMGSALPAGTRRCLSREAWQRELAELEAVAFTDMTKQTPRAVQFSQVSPELAAQVLAVTGEDVSDYWHSLDALHLLHLSKHSNVFLETRRGNLPLTEDDLLNLPEILATPDSVEYSRVAPDGFKRLVITKRVNGTVFVVEELRGRSQQLQVITLWKKKATAKDVITKMPLSCTPESDRRCEANKAPAAPAVKPTPGVDLYVGGTEHAVLHLLYARFWHKVLYDLGHVSTAEPFYKLVNQGLILGADGQKMSKSRGNVVNPDDVLVDYGADAFRLYEMFMGPLQDTKPWNTQGVEGGYRFLGRVWRLFIAENSETAFEQAQTVATQPDADLLDHLVMNGTIAEVAATPAQLKALHACIKKVTEDLDGLRFNTAISAMMVFVNEANGWQTRPLAVMRPFLQLLAPFAPHLVEELWSRLHSTFGQRAPSLTYAAWPSYDPALLIESEVEIPVSVNGKVRDVIRIAVGADDATHEAAARAAEKVKPLLEGQSVKKVIIKPGKMVNLVVG